MHTHTLHMHMHIRSHTDMHIVRETRKGGGSLCHWHVLGVLG